MQCVVVCEAFAFTNGNMDGYIQITHSYVYSAQYTLYGNCVKR